MSSARCPRGTRALRKRRSRSSGSCSSPPSVVTSVWIRRQNAISGSSSAGRTKCSLWLALARAGRATARASADEQQQQQVRRYEVVFIRIGANGEAWPRQDYVKPWRLHSGAGRKLRHGLGATAFPDLDAMLAAGHALRVHPWRSVIFHSSRIAGWFLATGTTIKKRQESCVSCRSNSPAGNTTGVNDSTPPTSLGSVRSPRPEESSPTRCAPACWPHLIKTCPRRPTITVRPASY